MTSSSVSFVSFSSAAAELVVVEAVVEGTAAVLSVETKKKMKVKLGVNSLFPYSHFFLPGEVVVPGLVVVLFTVEILAELSLFVVEDSVGIACPLDTGLGFIVSIITIKIKTKKKSLTV